MAWLNKTRHCDKKESRVVSKQLLRKGPGTRKKRTCFVLVLVYSAFRCIIDSTVLLRYR